MSIRNPPSLAHFRRVRSTFGEQNPTTQRAVNGLYYFILHAPRTVPNDLMTYLGIVLAHILKPCPGQTAPPRRQSVRPFRPFDRVCRLGPEGPPPLDRSPET